VNITRALAVAVVLTTLAIASPVRAQSLDTAVAAVDTPVFIAPDATKTPLRVASAGTSFVVLEDAGEWTKVQFQDPQWGRRVGYVATKNLRVHRAALAPMDLSVKPEAATPALPVETAPLATPPPPSPTPAKSTPSSGTHGFERGWIDINFGVAVAASKTFTTTLTTPLFQETRTEQASYRNPTGAEFDFGGGYMITPGVGVGISFTGTAHQDEAQLYINVPHPTRFDAFASSTKPTDAKLQRAEGGVNLQLMLVAPVSPRAKVRLFLGPTYFRVQQDMVGTIAYDQAFLVFLPVNAVDITTYENDKVEGTGWGFHVGGDVSYYFTRVVGIGGFARFSRATVSLDDPLSGLPVDVKAGGFQAGGGLRLKF
jgi:Legionella pneumophila major outer membrane protein precursor